MAGQGKGAANCSTGCAAAEEFVQVQQGDRCPEIKSLPGCLALSWCPWLRSFCECTAESLVPMLLVLGNVHTCMSPFRAACSLSDGPCPTVLSAAALAAQTVCMYQYRVRALPLDEFSDSFAAIQTIATDANNNNQPCWPVDASPGWPFCSYWQKATACAVSPWDPTVPLNCELLPTDDGSGGGDNPYDYTG